MNSRLQLALLNRKKQRNLLEKGFTLVELMIVIVIVGILSGVALPSFLNQTAKAKATECTTKFGAMLSQVAAEAQLSLTDADALATTLVADGNTNSSNCVFAITAPTGTSTIYTGTVTGADELLNKYVAAGCVNFNNSKRQIRSSTSTTGTAPSAPTVTCT